MAASQQDGADFLDVIVIGAGISGINVAYRLQEQSPDRTYTIIEARGALGGTWDLFRYPGIRTDSDMITFGFPFYPWDASGGRTMAGGADIVKYLKGATSKYGIDQKIRYNHKLIAADWSTDEQNWVLTVDASGTQKYLRSRFVVFATGYYDYNEALPAKIPGIDRFQGQVIHPQFWPEDLDYKDKSVCVIGSGATAITLIPNLAKKTDKVVMLQRSPTFIVTLPQQESWFQKVLPFQWAYKILRLQYLILPFLFFKFCKTYPGPARNYLKKEAAKRLPEGYPLEPNFEPKYNPWDQRLCVSPDGDFYQTIKDGKAEVVTAHIKQITEKSIHLEDSDRTIEPDIIITATGLKLMIGGGAKISVDKQPINVSEKHLYKGAMVQDVPNAAMVVGYTNASWTLGSDATAQFVTRLLNQMSQSGNTQAIPKVNPASGMQDRPVLNLNSTYIVKAEGELPKAGDQAPWLPRVHYLWDLWEAKFGSFTKDMHFSRVST